MLPDFSGEVSLNLTSGLVTSCCSCKTACWRLVFWREGPRALVTPVKAIREEVWLMKSNQSFWVGPCTHVRVKIIFSEYNFLPNATFSQRQVGIGAIPSSILMCSKKISVNFYDQMNQDESSNLIRFPRQIKTCRVSAQRPHESSIRSSRSIW